MLLYYISDRTQFSGSEGQRRNCLLERIAATARNGVDFIQLREKDMPARDLEALARAAVKAIRSASSTTRLLINSRIDVALAVEADGVHLRANDISPADVRKIWRQARRGSEPVISLSCHSDADVMAAKITGTDFAVFAPVFEKRDALEAQAAGIEQLRSACQHGIPVFALGGVRAENAHSCLQAGAVGIAGIRLFQEGELVATLEKLREKKLRSE